MDPARTADTVMADQRMTLPSGDAEYRARWKALLPELKRKLLAVPVRGAARKARLHAELKRVWPRIEEA